MMPETSDQPLNVHGPLEQFKALPRRLFLDSSTLQTLLDYGETVFEGEAPPPGSRAYVIPGRLQDLEALRLIFAINERAMFDFVLSDRSLDEVADKRDSAYAQWALAVLDHWHIRISEYKGCAFDGSGEFLATRLDEPRFGYLSVKDKRLLRDAIAFECDAFLTMETRLSKMGSHIEAHLGIKVLRPTELWGCLEPWAALYR